MISWTRAQAVVGVASTTRPSGSNVTSNSDPSRSPSARRMGAGTRTRPLRSTLVRCTRPIYQTNKVIYQIRWRGPPELVLSPFLI